VQFCIIFVHNGQVLFRDCDYPKFIAFLLSAQALFFLYLFGSFYHRSYVQSRKWDEARQKRQQARLAAKAKENKALEESLEAETKNGVSIHQNGKIKAN
ncbi:hypothetical protein HHI36_008943, partial [Cryptolaemus montrouzieri]